MSFHHDTRFDPERHHYEIHLGYDGSLRVSSNADLVSPDGTRLELTHGHTARLGPEHPHARLLAEVLRPLVREHYAALGLRAPADHELPAHLRANGHPAFAQPDLAPEHAALLATEVSDGH